MRDFLQVRQDPIKTISPKYHSLILLDTISA